jgi:hypothetical protein
MGVQQQEGRGSADASTCQQGDQLQQGGQHTMHTGRWLGQAHATGGRTHGAAGHTPHLTSTKCANWADDAEMLCNQKRLYS